MKWPGSLNLKGCRLPARPARLRKWLGSRIRPRGRASASPDQQCVSTVPQRRVPSPSLLSPRSPSGVPFGAGGARATDDDAIIPTIITPKLAPIVHRANAIVTLVSPVAATASRTTIASAIFANHAAVALTALGALLPSARRPAVAVNAAVAASEDLFRNSSPPVIGIISSHPPSVHGASVTTATHRTTIIGIVTAATMMADMVMTTVPIFAASLGGGPPRVAVAVGSVCALPPTSGGGDGTGGAFGTDELMAAASTTCRVSAVTTFIIVMFTPTIPIIRLLTFLLPGDVLVVIMDDAHTLLPIRITANGSSDTSGRGRTSEGPRRDRRFLAHSPPPSAAKVVGAAWRGVGRPSALVNTALTATPPRPGPASLLASSKQPQQGCSAQRGSRVGEPLRAARTAT